MTSLGNKHQRDYRFIDPKFHRFIFTQKLLKFLSKTVFQIRRRNKLQTNKNFPALMTPIHNKHQSDYGLIEGSFHKNFGIHVSSSLNRDNQRSNKDKPPYFDDVITQ